LRDLKESGLSNLYSRLRDEPIDPFVRARLVRRVMAATLDSPAAAPARPFVGAWGWLAAAAAAILVGLGLTVLEHHPGSPDADPVRIVSVQANGGVHIRWTDTGKRQYQLLKSESPADFSHAERIAVTGTHYVDPQSTSSQVIYYRVE